jgi:eukaryotic-like serine/threonine-protein kinase
VFGRGDAQMARPSRLDSQAVAAAPGERVASSYPRPSQLLQSPGGRHLRVARLESYDNGPPRVLLTGASPPAPLVVGRYALFDSIASGGMASVHIGRLIGAFGFSRTVAIKRLHRDSALDPEFIAMFLEEAKLAARIHHPNVVPTLDVVALGDELLLVMEYVSGAALAQILTQERNVGRPTPHRIAVDIMIGVLNGLHAAHEATNEAGEPLNIVHRDVSPQNILIGTDGVARVLDFGIAKAVGGPDRSLPNQVKGKLRYLSPESISAQRVTRATDIYSASVVLWEMLAGRRLFGDPSNAQVVAKIMSGSILPPSQFQPHISRKLDEVVMCGLNRNPTSRHRSAQAMACALEAAVTAIARSTVSAWVSASVGSQIRARDELVGRIERDERAEARAVSTPVQAAVATAVAHDVTRPLAVSGFVAAAHSPGRYLGRRLSPFALCAAACLVTLSLLAARHVDGPELPAPMRAKSGSKQAPHTEFAFPTRTTDISPPPSLGKPVRPRSNPVVKAFSSHPARPSTTLKSRHPPSYRQLYRRD